jgi:hypothetical protein
MEDYFIDLPAIKRLPPSEYDVEAMLPLLEISGETTRSYSDPPSSPCDASLTPPASPATRSPDLGWSDQGSRTDTPPDMWSGDSTPLFYSQPPGITFTPPPAFQSPDLDWYDQGSRTDTPPGVPLYSSPPPGSTYTPPPELSCYGRVKRPARDPPGA